MGQLGRPPKHCLSYLLSATSMPRFITERDRKIGRVGGGYSLQSWLNSVSDTDESWLMGVTDIAKLWVSGANATARFWPCGVKNTAKYWIRTGNKTTKFDLLVSTTPESFMKILIWPSYQCQWHCWVVTLQCLWYRWVWLNGTNSTADWWLSGIFGNMTWQISWQNRHHLR
jgi:hypothetical protein